MEQWLNFQWKFHKCSKQLHLWNSEWIYGCDYHKVIYYQSDRTVVGGKAPIIRSVVWLMLQDWPWVSVTSKSLLELVSKRTRNCEQPGYLRDSLTLYKPVRTLCSSSWFTDCTAPCKDCYSISCFSCSSTYHMEQSVWFYWSSIFVKCY